MKFSFENGIINDIFFECRKSFKQKFLFKIWLLTMLKSRFKYTINESFAVVKTWFSDSFRFLFRVIEALNYLNIYKISLNRITIFFYNIHFVILKMLWTTQDQKKKLSCYTCMHTFIIIWVWVSYRWSWIYLWRTTSCVVGISKLNFFLFVRILDTTKTFQSFKLSIECFSFVFTLFFNARLYGANYIILHIQVANR